MQCPDGYQDFISDSMYCFKQFKDNKTWPSAQETCKNDGGNLVCFATPEERDFWKSNCDKCWSGYNRIDGIVIHLKIEILACLYFYHYIKLSIIAMITIFLIFRHLDFYIKHRVKSHLSRRYSQWK